MALKDYRDMQKRCSNCSFCKYIPFDKVTSARFAENCPANCYFLWNAYSARGRFLMGRDINEGKVTADDAKTAEIIQNCLACGACDIACKICRYNLEPLEHNLELKKAAIEAGAVLPVQKEMAESLQSEQTMLRGKKHQDRTAWMKDLHLPDARTEEVEYIFFPGCKYAYEQPGDAYKAANLLLKAGVSIGYLYEDDACCGGRMHQMGMTGAFEQEAKANIARFDSVKAKAIVTPCADCYHALKRQYAALGLKMEVYHLVELLDVLLAEGKLKLTKPVNATVTYHDPCHLGRLGEAYEAWNGKEKKILNQVHTYEPARPRYNGVHGIYDAPRNLIQAVPGIKLVEMERIREYSWCCGAGGGCTETNPAFSDWTAQERMEEAKSTGAEYVITSCPWCTANLAKAKGSMKVMDLIDLLTMAL